MRSGGARDDGPEGGNKGDKQEQNASHGDAGEDQERDFHP